MSALTVPPASNTSGAVSALSLDQAKESLRYDDPLAVEPPTFDTIRHNSTLFAISGGENRPSERII